MLPPSQLFRPAAGRRRASAIVGGPAAGVAAVALALAAAGCGSSDSRGTAFGDSLTPSQVAGLDRVWTQRLRTTNASGRAAARESSKLYRSCAALPQESTFLQAVHATCTPTALSVKLAAVVPDRCSQPSRRCIRALDRAAAANDTRLLTLLQLNDAAKSATDVPDCLAEFTTDEAKAHAYRELSAAFAEIAVAARRDRPAQMRTGQARAAQAQAVITSRLSVREQVARFRQSCGIARSGA
ncbi:MAG: hypothetical protein QM679_02815 [Patulibacter sp.]